MGRKFYGNLDNRLAEGRQFCDELSTRLFIRTCKNYGDAIARSRETKEYYEGLPSVYDVTVTVQKMETTGEAVEV